MQFGYSETCLDHDTGPRHPETARPTPGHTARARKLTASSTSPLTRRPRPRPAVQHRLLAEFREFCDDGGGNWDADTVAVEETWDAALASAGLAVGQRSRLDGNRP